MKKIIIDESEITSLPNDMDLGAYTRKKMNDLSGEGVIFVRRKFFLTEKTNQCQNNQILFSSDGKAWVSDGYNSFRVFYNPFDGTLLRLSDIRDFDYLPGFLVGKKINNVRLQDNKIFFSISKGEFAMYPSCRESFIGNINIEELDKIVESVVVNVDYYIDNVHVRGTIQGILKLNIKIFSAEYNFDWIIKNSTNCSLILEKLN